jgi:hypothetical protein
MPKPEIILSFIEKIPTKREEVTTVCIGDYDGDGKQEIIFGGGKSEDTTLVQAIRSIETKDRPILNHQFENGYILETLCFDIDDDGKDEIICGNSEGELFYIDCMAKEKKSKKVNLASFTKPIKSIKVIKTIAETFIFASSRDGNIGICKFKNGKYISKELVNLGFEIWSLLPILNENKIILIVGGENVLSIIEIIENGDRNPKHSIVFPPLKKGSNPQEYKERIYDICLIEHESDNIKFACGGRGGTIYLFCLKDNLKLLKEIKSGESIYKLNYFDVDICGSKEIIAVGEIEKNGEEIGYLEIFKIEPETLRFRSINVSTYEKRIFSVLPMLYKNKDKNYLLLSAAFTPLVLFEISTVGWIKEIIYPLALQISEKKSKKICFFLGAGISSEVFPVADEMSSIIRESTKVKPETIKNYLKKNDKFKKFFQNNADVLSTRIPLEAMLFWYKNHYGRENMLHLISKHYRKTDIKTPNSINAIAKLIELNLINYVFTVNYDTLLENKLNNIIPLIRQEDYTSTEVCHKQAILKLHGSVDSPESIEGALDEVTELKGNKKQVLDFLLNGHQFIFIGYSCRDLDIFPAIKEMVEKHKTNCYFVDPVNPNDNIKEIIMLSRGGDIESRYFQIKSDLFFEFLSENLYDAKGIEILKNTEVI